MVLDTLSSFYLKIKSYFFLFLIHIVCVLDIFHKFSGKTTRQAPMPIMSLNCPYCGVVSASGHVVVDSNPVAGEVPVECERRFVAQSSS